MTGINRILMVLVFAAFGVFVWALIAHTEWAASRSLLGVGDAFQNPLTPLIEIAGTVMIVVAVAKLVQQSAAWFAQRVLGRSPRSRIPIDRSTGGV